MSSEVLPGWPQRLRGYLALARISNSPTVVSNVLAGAALGAVAAGTPVDPGTLLALMTSMVAYYTAGMYLNDYLDYQIDRRERPERPLPSGLVSRNAALAVTLALFALGTLLLWPLGLLPILGGTLLIGLIVLYDAWHKTNPLSPVIMALNRAMVYVIAFVAVQPALTATLLVWAAALGLYIVGLTYIAKTELRATFASVWPAALLFLPALLAVAGGLTLTGWALALAFVGWAAFCLTFVYGKARQPGRAVAQLIAGVSLLDALVLAVAGAYGLVPLALIAFALTLFLQRYIKGT